MATRKSGDEAKRVLDAIRQLVRALRIYDREAQSRYGLSAAQMFILHALDTDDPLSLNQLADRTMTDQSSASVVVQRLVEAGHVSRTARKADRRHIELRLTQKGRATIRNSPPPAQEKIRSVVEHMPPAQRKQFAELIEGFVAAFGARARKAPMLFEDEPARRPRKRA